MKVCVPNGTQKNEILKDPVRGFPFSMLPDIEPCADMEAADVLFPDFGGAPYTGEVQVISAAIMREVWYKTYAKKIAWVSLCDFPYFSQVDTEGIKFVLSPLAGRERNKECHVHAMPCHPCQQDYRIQMDSAYTTHCRSLPKGHRFAFIGQLTGGAQTRFFGGRSWILQLSEGRLHEYMMHRDKCGSAWSNTWWGDHRQWMIDMAGARYGFCPAGASNGPRGWWTMQVGTVPIFTDVELFPFEAEVDWSKLCIQIPHDKKLTYDYMSLPIEGPEYDQMRSNCMAFWDEFCWMPKLAARMGEKIKEHVCGS